MSLYMFWSIYFISLQKVKFDDLLTSFQIYDVIWHHNDNRAPAATTTSLIELLFHKFIVYIMNYLCAKLGCHISNNNRDKQGGGADVWDRVNTRPKLRRCKFFMTRIYFIEEWWVITDVLSLILIMNESTQEWKIC